jgi:hypothetical protein
VDTQQTQGVPSCRLSSVNCFGRVAPSWRACGQPPLFDLEPHHQGQAFIDMAPACDKVAVVGPTRRPKTLNKFRYAFDICLGTTLLWFLLRYLGDTDPVWAIVSFIVVTDPSIEKAQRNFFSRVTNTLLGCIAGTISVLVFGPADWMLPIALTITALACTLLIEGQSSWKLATATAALVLTSAIVSHSSLTAIEEAFRRTREVALGGCPLLAERIHYSAERRDEGLSFNFA